MKAVEAKTNIININNYMESLIDQEHIGLHLIGTINIIFHTLSS